MASRYAAGVAAGAGGGRRRWRHVDPVGRLLVDRRFAAAAASTTTTTANRTTAAAAGGRRRRRRAAVAVVGLAGGAGACGSGAGLLGRDVGRQDAGGQYLEAAYGVEIPDGREQLADLRHAVGYGEADGPGLVDRAVLHADVAAVGYVGRDDRRGPVLARLGLVLLPELHALGERQHAPAAEAKKRDF